MRYLKLFKIFESEDSLPKFEYIFFVPLKIRCIYVENHTSTKDMLNWIDINNDSDIWRTIANSAGCSERDLQEDSEYLENAFDNFLDPRKNYGMNWERFMNMYLSFNEETISTQEYIYLMDNFNKENIVNHQLAFEKAFDDALFRIYSIEAVDPIRKKSGIYSNFFVKVITSRELREDDDGNNEFEWVKEYLLNLFEELFQSIESFVVEKDKLKFIGAIELGGNSVEMYDHSPLK